MTKKDIKEIYSNRSENYHNQLVKLTEKSNIISALRLILFILIAGLVIYFATTNVNLIVYTLFFGLVFFVVLVKHHEKLHQKKKFVESLKRINREEIGYLNNNWSGFEDGSRFLKKQSLHARDLDLFGENSLYQKINRTVTISGSGRLAHWFRYPKQHPEEIIGHQQAIEELSNELDFRQEFRAVGLLATENSSDYKRLIRWMKEKPWVTSTKHIKVALNIFPFVNSILTLTSIFDITPWSLTGASILLTLGYLAPLQKKINRSYILLSKRAYILMKYVDLLKLFEQKKFKSETLNILQTEMTEDENTAFEHISELAHILQKLDQRLNMIMGILLNIYLLWDLRMLSKVEKWKANNLTEMIIWFNNIGIVDAFLSLANLKYNEPNWVFPEVSDLVLLEAQQLKHPLMADETCVPNDILIEKRPHFKIVTGANMAGKSTWLRTVGTNMVLAMSGSVVNAKVFRLTPTQIATSLHTADSLMKNESYFYSELLRLQEIIQLLQKGESVFILLDEILKGTNSGDKEAGSIALLKQLINLESYGIIATHDLNLAKISDLHKQHTENLRFEAEIIEDKLYFDYTIKPGIAQNFNATYLMRKMGITV
ncbi:MAG: hypothetical protein JXR34_10900 [Bacteroidales bacterium]|nr:hypothetical protein [Bacteroidales bacterium]